MVTKSASGRGRAWRSGLAWTAVGAGFVGNGLRLRRRVQSLEVLAPTDEPAARGFRLLTAPGVVVDADTRRAATVHARARGLESLDLVPADLPAERLLDLVRLVDPETYAVNPMAMGAGAGQAVLASDELLERARVDVEAVVTAADLDGLAVTLKRHAPWGCDLVLVPGMVAAASASDERWERQRRLYRGATSSVLTGRGAALGALALGLARRRPAAVVAAAGFHAAPALATVGTAARPADLVPAAAARAVRSAVDVVRSVREGWPAMTQADPEMAARREDYRPAMEEAALGLLHEAPRSDCPICGSTALTLELVARDLNQLKPGRFRLDRCDDCGTTFQNPRLSLDGLDFYYRDFYDGLWGEQLERIFAAEAPLYGERVDLVARFAEPRRWLDVGTGHGHFCLVARERWPKAQVEGLDMTDAIEEAERRGWVDRGHRGLFPDRAGGLAGRFDVVSMHHYLEHTRDPAAELDAAAVVLEPGGLLEIEVPDPESRLRKLFRNAWMHYFQPQHQHLVPLDTLTGLLAERGFTTLAVQRAEAHQPIDFMFAAALTVNGLVPLNDVPWAPEAPTVARRIARNALMAAAAPIVALGAGIDRGLRPVIAARWPNTYRLVARYDGGS